MFTYLKRVTALLLLTCATVISTTALADSNAAPMKFVGTFFSVVDSRLVTYHSDGTVSLVSANMFTDDPTQASGGRKSTPQSGVWRKVDNNKIQATTLYFVTEAFGHNYGAAGFFLKVTWLAIYDDPVQGKSPGYTAVNTVSEVFLPGQNPNSDVPVAVFPFPDSSAERLKAE